MEEARKAFREALRTLTDGSPQVLPARVTAVNPAGNTCTVVLEEGGAEYDDVRLTASADDATDRLLMVPAVGSRVLVGVTDGLWGDFHLALCDKVSEVRFVLGNLTLKANGDGVEVTRGNVTVQVGDKVNIKKTLPTGEVSLKSALLKIITGVSSAQGANVPFLSGPDPTSAQSQITALFD